METYQRTAVILAFVVSVGLVILLLLMAYSATGLPMPIVVAFIVAFCAIAIGALIWLIFGPFRK